MDTDDADLARLSLLIQRILDADALCDAEGATLLTATEAARQSLKEGDKKTAHRHIEQVTRYAEALVQTNRLAPGDGHAVIMAANGILRQEADEGT